jgi:hypothetical protein
VRASAGDRQLPRCSGFLIEWDATRRQGTVVTSADLICSSKSMDDWSGRDVHCPHAKVSLLLACAFVSQQYAGDGCNINNPS